MPLQRGKPSEIREDLEHNLLECDALVVVYGRSTAAWVRSQLLQCRKSFSKRDSPLQSLSVYQGPPGPKEPLDLRLPNMQIIDCVSGFKEAKLKSFIEGLQTGGDR